MLSPSATSTSSAEVSQLSSSVLTKSEPEVKSEMCHDLDCEFFQSLQWCGPPAEQDVVQSIDNPKTTNMRTLTTDTQIHTHFSPQGWDASDAISPSAQAYSSYQPSNPVSPNVESDTFNMDNFNEYIPNSHNIPFQEQFLDISTLPVLIDDLASESNIDTNPWLPTESVWEFTNEMEYNKPLTDTYTLPFIDQEDSLDTKLVSVTPREVENNDVMISEYIINGDANSGGVQKVDDEKDKRNGAGLSVDIFDRSQPWDGDIISTPEVLSVVEQLEDEKCPLLPSIASAQEDTCIEETTIENSPHLDYEPITPKTEPHIDSDIDVNLDKRKRRRHDSEDSDESYKPYTEHTPRKYKKRKPSLAIKDMIREIEGSQQLPKARRGRPPKRRESTISTVSENSSMSTHDFKYRELRDKNNEASKRSRMNRKLKELQMEQLVEELEDRNKKLRVRAQLLEDMTKKLREAFMTVVTQKKNL